MHRSNNTPALAVRAARACRGAAGNALIVQTSSAYPKNITVHKALEKTVKKQGGIVC